jgi:hypothetical protein
MWPPIGESTRAAFVSGACFVPPMHPSVFVSLPDRIQRGDVTVMQQTTADDLAHIQAMWPSFEQLVGLRGRKMYALMDTAQNSYTVATPVRDGDDPDRLGLQVGTLPGGWYLRGRIVGEPPRVYKHIADGMSELEATMPADLRGHWSSSTADATRSISGCRSRRQTESLRAYPALRV